ncbi:hypothetical protein FC86_GL000156 [Holzapfeliella floricola DSM 23037 = JCM 16512]|uniref:Uncharacterized protein n=1 Tax=Holzapfeliella floricola DSM 23037 = JCM 16512 TaxID=1423744 RepID=A0A0R2DK30_9LACO|nr:hypothetical protein FC86_GL000156 [Holzapfeliella floricola DSM 23037 = JCM 16512]
MITSFLISLSVFCFVFAFATRKHFNYAKVLFPLAIIFIVLAIIASYFLFN